MWQWTVTQPNCETDAGVEEALWAMPSPCICTLLQIDDRCEPRMMRVVQLARRAIATNFWISWGAHWRGAGAHQPCEFTMSPKHEFTHAHTQRVLCCHSLGTFRVEELHPASNGGFPPIGRLPAFIGGNPPCRTAYRVDWRLPAYIRRLPAFLGGNLP